MDTGGLIERPGVEPRIRMQMPASPWKNRLGATAVVFIAVLFSSAWGGTQAIWVASGISCLVAMGVNYLAASSQPEFRWRGGLILAGPLAALIILNAFMNPQEAGLIPFWLLIAVAIYVSAAIGGMLGTR